MATLPYSRVVNVTLTREDAFPTRRGFGIVLHLTNTAVNGVVDATHLTKLYGSMDEVAADFASTADAYKAAEAAFSQNPRPLAYKIGYLPLDVTPTAAEVKTALDAIYNIDQNWYFLTIDAAMRDQAYLDGLIEWVEAKPKLAIIDSNDATMQDKTNTTNVAARNKGEFERTAVFYTPVAADYGADALAARLCTFNFDEADSAYTAKFKQLAGIDAVNLGSNAISAITGFTPGVGQSEADGHVANTYIDIGQQDFVVEGSVLKQNVFIDEIHSTDWIIARTEEESLAILLNNARVPFDDGGMEVIASAARTVMRQASRAGLIARDLDPETGLYEAAVTITVPSVFDVPASQRKNRIAPAIAVRFRYSGAVHYTTINYTMTF